MSTMAVTERTTQPVRTERPLRRPAVRRVGSGPRAGRDPFAPRAVASRSSHSCRVGAEQVAAVQWRLTDRGIAVVAGLFGGTMLTGLVTMVAQWAVITG